MNLADDADSSQISAGDDQDDKEAQTIQKKKKVMTMVAKPKKLTLEDIPETLPEDKEI